MMYNLCTTGNGQLGVLLRRVFEMNYFKLLGILILLLVLVSTSVFSTPQRVFFVSNLGNDHWSGLLPAGNAASNDGPFASLEKARDAARTLRMQDREKGITNRDIKIVVRGGTYNLTKPLLFTPADSGANNHPTIYTAFPGERPVISGGRTIAGWKKGPGALWTAKVRKGWFFTRMFVDGRMKTRSREPDTDNWSQWFKVKKGGPAEKDAPEGIGSKIFDFPPNTIENYTNPRDVEINSLPSYKYANFISTINKVKGSTVTLTSMAYYNFNPGDEFRVENTLKGVDTPGEWCVNSYTGTVYYFPEKGEDVRKAKVTAPILKQLICIKGDETKHVWVHDLTFSGFTFTNCDRNRWDETPKADEANLHILDAAVYLEGTQRCSIEDCIFDCVGGFGARFAWSAYNDKFIRNEVKQAGCGGIQIGGYGPGTKDTNKGHIVSHNHIHHSSLDFWHAGAIDIRQSGNNYIGYNLIDHMPYTGITISGAHTGYFTQYRNKGEGIGRAKYNFRWNEIPKSLAITPENMKPYLHGRNNIVEHNVLYDLLAKLPSDGGALYGFGQGLGNVFRNNLVYRAYCLGIYLDAEFDGVKVANNVAYDCNMPFGGSGAYPVMSANKLYGWGETPEDVRILGNQLTRMAEQVTGPAWSHDTSVSSNRQISMQNGVFRSSFKNDKPGMLADGGEWSPFGPSGGLYVGPAVVKNGYNPGMVTEAAAGDSWSSIDYGSSLDGSKEIVMQLDACIPANGTPGSSYELYLNRGGVHKDVEFGMAIVAGLQDGVNEDRIGVRMEKAGTRYLSTQRITLGHWYRVRMVIPANKLYCKLEIQDLTAGEKEFRTLSFEDGKQEITLCAKDTWEIPLVQLDKVILHMSGSAQVAEVVLQNK